MPTELAATLAALAGFALVDSLNPTCLTVLSALLTRKEGARAGLAFTAGVLVTYLGLGALILSGGTFLLSEDFWARVERGSGYAVQSAMGLLLVGLNWRPPSAAREEEAPRVRSASWPALMSMGAAANLADLPTAVPYFAALQIILTAGAHEIWEFGLLAAYNLVYVGPMLAMILVRALFGEALIGRLRSRWPDLEHRVAVVSRGLLLALGGALLLDASCFLALGSGFLP